MFNYSTAIEVCSSFFIKYRVNLPSLASCPLTAVLCHCVHQRSPRDNGNFRVCTSSHIAVPITKGFIGKTRGSTIRGSCWYFVPTGMEGYPSHSPGLSLFNSNFCLSWNTFIRHASASATPRLLDPYGWVLFSGIPTPYNPDRFGLKSLLTCTRTASWNTLS